MKFILIIPLVLLLTACAAQPEKTTGLAPLRELGLTVPPNKTAAVRVPETIKAYRFGRYVDPSNRRVMHEAHTVYRQEISPRWNLKGNVTTPSNFPGERPRHQPLRDELLMELNRQRQATRLVVQSGEDVSAKLQEVTAALKENQKMAEQHLRLQQQLQETTNRLDALESAKTETSEQEPEPQFSDW